MDKLEILEQFKNKYGTMINPELISLKYCQTKTEALVEMLFSTNSSTPAIINLDFISDDSEQENIKGNDVIPLLFKPEADIVDNASCLIDLDSYSLLNCIDKLFSKKAEQEINNTQQMLFKSQTSQG